MWRLHLGTHISAQSPHALLLVEPNGAPLGARPWAERGGRCSDREGGAIFEVQAIVDLTLRIDATTEPHGPRQPRRTEGAMQ